MSVLSGILVNLKGLLKGLLKGFVKGLFPIVFVGIGRKNQFWKLTFQNRKLGALEIEDEVNCVKLVGVFTFLFLIALCSTWVILCASSESLAMESCSYSYTRDHPTGNQLDNLISLFISLAFLQLMLDWQTDLPYYLSISAVGILYGKRNRLKSNWSLLPSPFMLCTSGFLYFFKRGSMLLFIWACIPSNFVIEIVKHHI